MLIATTVVAAAPATLVYSAEEYQKQGLNASVTNAKSKNDISAIDELISRYSALYDVPEPLMRHIISRESTYYPKAVGDKNYYCKRTGQIAPSYGLAQINVCWHDVTIEEAFEPEFAVEFLARHLSEGKCYLWSTCPQVYRN